MLPVIIPVAIGFLLGHYRVFHRGAADALMKFLLYVTFPGVILGNLTGDHLEELFNPSFILATVVATVGMFVFTYFAHKWYFHKGMRITAMASLSVAFVSAGIVGIPIMNNIIGIKATLVPVILNTMVALMTVVPLTILLLRLNHTRKESFWRIIELTVVDALKNPLIASSIVGLTIAVLGIKLPGWMTETFAKLGQATFATALVTVGIGINLRTIQKDVREILFLSTLRVIVFTIVGFSIALLFRLPPILAVPFVMIMSLPTAKSVPALGEAHDGIFVHESMQIVTLTTLMTVIIMPIVVVSANYIWPGVIR